MIEEKDPAAVELADVADQRAGPPAPKRCLKKKGRSRPAKLPRPGGIRRGGKKRSLRSIMSEENKAIVHRYVEEAINQRNMDVLDEIFAQGFVDHTAAPGQAPGVEGII